MRAGALAACLCVLAGAALAPVAAALAARPSAARLGGARAGGAAGGAFHSGAASTPQPRLGALLASVQGSHVASLESAASKAGETGRKVAMSLIGLAFAIAAIVLAFRRDFKEAAGVFAVGILAVLLATPAGVSLLRETVKTLVGA